MFNIKGLDPDGNERLIIALSNYITNYMLYCSWNNGCQQHLR